MEAEESRDVEVEIDEEDSRNVEVELDEEELEGMF